MRYYCNGNGDGGHIAIIYGSQRCPLCASHERIAELEAEVDQLTSDKITDERLSSAAAWEADHQRRHLQERGLEEEFPWGCDAIGAVADALLVARAQIKELEAQLNKTCGCGWVGDREYHECADHAETRERLEAVREWVENGRSTMLQLRAILDGSKS